jgi:hypothetical protein
MRIDIGLHQNVTVSCGQIWAFRLKRRERIGRVLQVFHPPLYEMEILFSNERVFVPYSKLIGEMSPLEALVYLQDQQKNKGLNLVAVAG